jgi:predicted DNA-binding transcriptional regulator AlpA
MRNDSPDMLLNRVEAAAEFGLSKRFLEIAAWNGSGPPLIRIGRRAVRYRRGDIRDWIEQRRIDPEAAAERPARRMGRPHPRAVPEGARPNERP